MKRKMMFWIVLLFMQFAVYGANEEAITESAIAVKVEKGIAIAESTKIKTNESNNEKKEEIVGISKLQEAQIYIEEENFIAAEKKFEGSYKRGKRECRVLLFLW